MIPSARNGTQRGIRPKDSWERESTTKTADARQPAPKKMRGKLASKRLFLGTKASREAGRRSRSRDAGVRESSESSSPSGESDPACGRLRRRCSWPGSGRVPPSTVWRGPPLPVPPPRPRYHSTEGVQAVGPTRPLPSRVRVRDGGSGDPPHGYFGRLVSRSDWNGSAVTPDGADGPPAAAPARRAARVE